MSMLREKQLPGAHAGPGIAAACSSRPVAQRCPRACAYLLPAAPACPSCSRQTSAGPRPRRRTFGRPGRSDCNCQGTRRTFCSRHHRRFPASAPWSGPALADRQTDRQRAGDGAAGSGAGPASEPKPVSGRQGLNSAGTRLSPPGLPPAPRVAAGRVPGCRRGPALRRVALT